MIPFPYVLRRRMMGESGSKTVIIKIPQYSLNGRFVYGYYNGTVLDGTEYEMQVGDVIQIVSMGKTDHGDYVAVNDEIVASAPAGSTFTYDYKVVKNAVIVVYQESPSTPVDIYEEGHPYYDYYA